MSPGSAPAGVCNSQPTAPPPLTGATGGVAIIPSKRVLDDDIQFVSEKPIKKPKHAANEQVDRPNPVGSSEQPEPLSIQTAPVGQDHTAPGGQDQITPGGQDNTAPGGQEPISNFPETVSNAGQQPPQSERRGSTGNIELPLQPLQSPPETPPEQRGVSLPVMENFTFSRKFLAPTRATPSSPQVSPKQKSQQPLKQTQQPAQPSQQFQHAQQPQQTQQQQSQQCRPQLYLQPPFQRHAAPDTFFEPFSYSDMFPQASPYTGIEGPFDFISPLPPHMTMTPESAFSQRDPNIPSLTDMLLLDGHGNGQTGNPQGNLLALAHVAGGAAPQGQATPQSATDTGTGLPTALGAPLDRQQADMDREQGQGTHKPSKATADSSPSSLHGTQPVDACNPQVPQSQPSQQAQLGQPSPQSFHFPHPGHSQLIHPLQAARAGQTMPSKMPCYICTQMRQQACLSNAHRMLPPAPPSNAFTNVAYPHQHPAQGPGSGMPPGFPPPQPMRHPNGPIDINSISGDAASPRPAQGRVPMQVSTDQAGHTGQPPLGALDAHHAGPQSVGTTNAQRAQAQTQTPSSTPPPSLQTTPPPSRQTTPAPTPPAAPKKTVIATAASARLASNSRSGSPSPAADDNKPQQQRKPAPNLYVDIAETCLDSFPYAEVARRHAVSRQRVHDVFAAVIQLPLLRCPTDARRVGRLGITRMKEYNKARKELTAAREGQAGRAGGGKQGEGQGKGQGQGQPPNMYEVAQFMGASDVPEGFKNGLTWPW